MFWKDAAIQCPARRVKPSGQPRAANTKRSQVFDFKAFKREKPQRRKSGMQGRKPEPFPGRYLMKTRLAAVLSIGLVLATGAANAQTSPATASKTSMEASEMAKSEHAAWSDLLEKYVVPAAGSVNRVDYAALKANSDDMQALEAYIASFETYDFDAQSTAGKIAAWSNLYNAVTVRHIVERYPVKSIRSGYIIGPWKRVKTVAGGEEISLNDIEHEVLRKLDEPRIHYSINCASYSCPDLQPKAFEAATLEKDLEDATRAYINDPRGVTVTDRGLVVSEIYKWFEDDFGGSKATVIDHLLEYADADLKAEIEANPKIRKYEYDWSLNDTE